MDEGVGPGRWQDDLYDLLRRNNISMRGDFGEGNPWQ